MTAPATRGFKTSDTIEFLVDRRAMAFARLDEDFVTIWRFGELADWLPLGANVCSGALPFVGMEPRLLALQDEPETSLLIPNVGMRRGNGEDLKISIQVFWDAAAESYLVVVYELGPQAELDRDLFKQLKARRLAEENFRKAREQVKEKQHLLELLMEHAPAAVAMLDPGLRYQFVTRRWAKAFGVEFEPLLGRRHSEVFPTEGGASEDQYLRCLSGEAVSSDVEKVRRPDGRFQWVRWDHQPWHRADGSIGGIISSAEILTELMITQQQLQERNAELAQLNGDLEEFTSIVAHDLSAPVRALRLAVERLGNEIQQSPGTDHSPAIDTLLGNVERIRTMLCDLHEYSRAAGRSRVVRDVDLQKLIEEIAASLPGASRFDIGLKGDCRVVQLPIAPIDLVLRNLLDNALKHHDLAAGRIEIAVEDRDTAWRFSVADDGPGIPLSDQKHIFRPFQKVHTDRPTPGSGIGLAIVKKTVEAHGGRDFHPVRSQ